jgi:hypothetical protein
MMTDQDARKLEVNTRVIWNNNAYDRGTVTKINPSGFYVRWDNGQQGWIDFRDAEKINLYQEVA